LHPVPQQGKLKNDEYKALLKEIADAQQKISDLETKEIELLDKLEETNKTIKKAEQIANERKKLLNEEKEELVELENNVKRQIQSLKDKRPEFLDKISADILSLYTRLLDKGVGTPVAEIHNGNCGNCHLKLTPQTVNTARKQELITCENCSHILYIAD